MDVSAFFVVLAGIYAALIIGIEIACEYPERLAVMRTKEWLMLLIVNIIVATLVIWTIKNYYHNICSMKEPVFGFSGYLIMIAIYLLLMHSKLFKISDVSIGIDYILQLSEKLLMPGIYSSIDEQYENLLREFRKIDINKLEDNTRDYLISKNCYDYIIDWVTNSAEDVRLNPDPKNVNIFKSSIFVRLREIGGQRAIRRVMKDK